MPINALDTCELSARFDESKGEGRLHEYTEADAKRWADDLIKFWKTNVIATPVAIELLARARNAHELRMYRAYLSKFRDVDEGRILATDWEEAANKAARIPSDGRCRDLVDCLLLALERRLNLRFITRDKRFRT
jgi:predicted nucleic acid-binding protein